MGEADLAEVWARSLDELAEMHLEPAHRAWLQLTRPLGLVENTALIATPNEFVKEQLETRLRALITHALSREFGRNIQLAVTVDPAAATGGIPQPREAAPSPGMGQADPGDSGFGGPGTLGGPGSQPGQADMPGGVGTAAPHQHTLGGQVPGRTVSGAPVPATHLPGGPYPHPGGYPDRGYPQQPARHPRHERAARPRSSLAPGRLR